MTLDVIVRFGYGPNRWTKIIRSYKGPLNVCPQLLDAYIRQEKARGRKPIEAYDYVEILGYDETVDQRNFDLPLKARDMIAGRWYKTGQLGRFVCGEVNGFRAGMCVHLDGDMDFQSQCLLDSDQLVYPAEPK